MRERRRKFWGWGYEDADLDEGALRKLAEGLASRFGVEELEVAPAPRIEEIDLRPPRVHPPSALADLFTDDPRERARHTYGASFRDVVRAYRRDFSEPPDWVALPRDEAGVAAVLDWCSSSRVAAVPYGGGSSVVGGVECAVGDAYAGVVSLDLRRLDRVLEIDRTSRAARIQAGIFGPALEDALRPHGLTLRHFPQSFEVSSLGGWLATRSGGHYATVYTHIEDFLESLRVVAPTGRIESRRLPGSGAGPSPDRFFVGSEGILGVITEAWMRLQQSGLFPANCRLLDPGEAATAGASQEGKSVLVVAFESADHALDGWMARALEIVREHGGEVPEGAGRTRTDSGASREGAAGAWRNAFLAAPYLRDALVAIGMLTETFETSITWERFEAFHSAVLGAARRAVTEVCGQGSVTCRFTHVYPDGPAPYYTILAPARKGSQLQQWREIKAACSEAVIEQGGTITHHHSVGRDHRRWYDRQRADGFARALRASKAALDPAAILNPGVLIDPPEGGAGAP
jgi:alkyldihydroxyacetonephosphate synthase